MLKGRGSGIVLHPTSLPGPFGIGDLGPSARRFADILARTGQTCWQMLPVSPVGAGNSPYSGTSSQAGNPLLISPDDLVEYGWIRPEEAEAGQLEPGPHVAFEDVNQTKAAMLEHAFERFGRMKAEEREAFDRFCAEQSWWLDDYALYEAIQARFGGRPWTDWPDRSLVWREKATLERARADFAQDFEFQRFVQFLFDRQWEALRTYLEIHQVRLMGDLPIYVSHDSADVWARPDLFWLDEAGRPAYVAGVPPDYFNWKGQRWGNPLYAWENHRREGFQWWIDRIQGCLRRFDLLRLDHFRGFEAYYAIPADAEGAANSRCRWEKAPGFELFTAMNDVLGTDLPLIAEDLGEITEDVVALRERFQLPGMKVLQFAFGSDPMAEQYLPHSYVSNCVVYTGTHDNDTTVGWLSANAAETTQPEVEVRAERMFVRQYLGLPASADPREVTRDLLRWAWGSVAGLAIAPLQDWLELGTEGRMNTPGMAHGNWGWRFSWNDLNEDVQARLDEYTVTYGRCPRRAPRARSKQAPENDVAHPTGG